MNLLSPIIPATVLALVACGQIYLAETRDLTAWKGGGFGMFSTLDGRDNRRLIITLVRGNGAEQRRVHAELPKDEKIRLLAERARALPTRERLQELGRALAKQPFRLVGKGDTGRPPRAKVLTSPREQERTQRAEFDAVELVLWKVIAVPAADDVLAVRSRVIHQTTVRADTRSDG